MLKTTFCKYLTSVKIKASKTYAYNKREAKKEIVYAEAMNTTKSDILLSYNMKTVIQLWGMQLCWGQNKNLLLEGLFL